MLKLYVWTGFSPDYTDGLAFAIASSEADAKKMVTNKFGLWPTEAGTLQVFPLTRRIAFAVSGGG